MRWKSYYDDLENRFQSPGEFAQACVLAHEVGHHVQNLLDRIQQQTQGYVVPESFTRGSSGQRVYWFTRGVETGDFDQCDTFATDNLQPVRYFPSGAAGRMLP